MQETCLNRAGFWRVLATFLFARLQHYSPIGTFVSGAQKEK
jgi:hypothetical protein